MLTILNSGMEISLLKLRWKKEEIKGELDAFLQNCLEFKGIFFGKFLLEDF